MNTKNVDRQIQKEHLDNTFVITTKNYSCIEQLKSIVNCDIFPMGFGNHYNVTFNEKKEIREYLNIFDNIQDIEKVELVSKAESIFVPNDTYAQVQLDYLSALDFSGVWDILNTIDYTPITTMILDNAYDTQHEDLVGNLLEGWDVMANIPYVDYRPFDSSNASHGTMCAGILGAVANNGKGCFGTAIGCKIYPLSLIGGPHIPNASSQFATGIAYSAQTGYKVLSTSFAYNVHYDYMEEACKLAYNAGVIITAGTGNNYSTQVYYPAAYNNYVVSISALDSVDGIGNNFIHKRANYGNGVTFLGPWYVYGLDVNNAYRIREGTSAASPSIASLISIIKSIIPTFSKDEMVQFISQYCIRETFSPDDPRPHILYGYGIPQFTKTIKSAIELTSGIIDMKKIWINGSSSKKIMCCNSNNIYKKAKLYTTLE